MQGRSTFQYAARLGWTLLVLCIISPWPTLASAQEHMGSPQSLGSAEEQQTGASGSSEPDTELKERQRELVELQVERARIEVNRLNSFWTEKWIAAFGAILVGVISLIAAVLVSWLTRRAAIGHAVHEKRLDAYPGLVRATAPLALFFPSGYLGKARLTQRKCQIMGKEMSLWYFENGLLLSKQARDVYFKFARAVTLASEAKRLHVPTFPKDAKYVSPPLIKNYQRCLKENYAMNDIENWFSRPARRNRRICERIFKLSKARFDANMYRSVRFRDFIFLQSLSSRLRTSLSKDLSSRRLP